MATETQTKVERRAGRGFLWAGLGLVLLAIALVAVQYGVLRWLTTPWHTPILLTLGAVFLVLAVARRRTVVRIAVLVLVIALAGFEWFFLTSMSRLPSYEGPARAGQPMPAFQTKLADGRTFTEKELQGDQGSVMVFFRGRW
jgi:hypothetical protein